MSASAREAPLLQVEALDAGYGAVQVLWEVSLDVRPGETVALIGPNGAGKSTLLRTISGLGRPWRGRVRFGGREIGGLAPEQIVRLGVAHVPQGRRLFADLSVRENLLLGAYAREDEAGIAGDFASVLDLFPALRDRLTLAASQLSGGEQQMAALGRALMARPRLLLIDEPSLGLAPIGPRSQATSTGCSRCSPSCASAWPSPRSNSAAASSRWRRWGAPSWLGRACC